MMKENMKGMPGNPKVLLDAVTDYNKVVIQYELESISQFDQMMSQEKAKSASAKKPAKSKGPKYTDLYLTGKREIFKIVE